MNCHHNAKIWSDAIDKGSLGRKKKAVVPFGITASLK
jgi:hypothetical protein